MALFFITGNKSKFEEVKSVLPEVEQLDIDLPEIQSTDAREIIKAKLLEALKHSRANFMVEDTSLYLECLNGLPGPLIKWFMKSLGSEGLFKIAERFGNFKATAKTIIGYANDQGIKFFEGSLNGTVVQPKGTSGFGWDPIFRPDGFQKSFAEMSQDEKNSISMRRMALNEMRNFLEQRV
jgi:inosine triphosphate pyrophosphatase